MKNKETDFEANYIKLLKIEERARKLADLRDINESKWNKLYTKLKNLTEFQKKCEESGKTTDYDYGDVIC